MLTFISLFYFIRHIHVTLLLLHAAAAAAIFIFSAELPRFSPHAAICRHYVLRYELSIDYAAY